MQKWRTWYFLQHSYERKSVVWRKKILWPGYLFSFFFDRVFLYPVFQNYFTVFLLALSFDIMQDICRRPVNAIFVEIQSWYLK